MFDPDLAQRLHNALTSGNEELFRVITDPAVEVLNAVLKNQKTSLVWYSVLLPTIPLNEVKNLLCCSSLSGAEKKELVSELKRRGIR